MNMAPKEEILAVFSKAISRKILLFTPFGIMIKSFVYSGALFLTVTIALYIAIIVNFMGKLCSNPYR